MALLSYLPQGASKLLPGAFAVFVSPRPDAENNSCIESDGVRYSRMSLGRRSTIFTSTRWLDSPVQKAQR